MDRGAAANNRDEAAGKRDDTSRLRDARHPTTEYDRSDAN
jgi:hypothetical protein